MDKLQERIRKLKNPSIVDLSLLPGELPPHIVQSSDTMAQAYQTTAEALLESLREIVPAVRFRWSIFALQGDKWLSALKSAMQKAKALGYYVILDAPEALCAADAAVGAESLSDYPFDAYLITAYAGSDIIKPYAGMCKENGRDLFVVLRSANKSAAELQDLLTGTRLVHTAAADVLCRIGESAFAACGYSKIAGVAAATAPDSVRTLRTKYPEMFLLIDGYDYTGANAKNCSYAFDRLGHGAAACARSSVAAAWLESQTDGTDFESMAVEAAKRMKNNLTRYTTIL